MRRLLVLCLAALLLLVELPVSPSAAQGKESGTVAVAAAAAGGQDVLVSRGVKGDNRAPAAAVDPNTGNVLVVWHAVGESAVWASLLRRKGSGKYKKPRPRRLSSGDGFQFGARVAWIEANKQFLVVWQRVGNSAADRSRRVLARAVNAKTGKPVGGVKTLVADAKSNTSPVITAHFADGVQTTQTLFNSGQTGSAVTALMLADLSDSYEVRTVATLVKAGTATSRIKEAAVLYESTLTRSATSGQPGGCVATITTEWDVESSVPQAVVRLFKDGEETFEQSFGENTLGIGVYLVGKTAVNGRFSLMAFAKDLGAERLVIYHISGLIRLCSMFFDAVIRRPLEPDAALAVPFLPETVRISRRPLLSSRNRGTSLAYIVTSRSDGKTYWQILDEDLALLDTRGLLFDHRNALTSMTGIDLTLDASRAKSSRAGRKSNSALMWTKSVGKDSDKEVRAYFFHLKPLE